MPTSKILVVVVKISTNSFPNNSGDGLISRNRTTGKVYLFFHSKSVVLVL